MLLQEEWDVATGVHETPAPSQASYWTSTKSPTARLLISVSISPKSQAHLEGMLAGAVFQSATLMHDVGISLEAARPADLYCLISSAV